MLKAGHAGRVSSGLSATAIASGRLMLGPKRLNVLIVEDDPLLALDLQQVLHRLRYRVVAVARSEREALRWAHAYDPDLAIVDIVLAEGCGVSAARAMLDDLGVPSIFLTSYADYETRQWAESADPVAFLSKPVSERQILRVLRGANLV